MKSKLINKVKNKFVKIFNISPVIVASPGRINLIGEHTDYNNGFVFPAAIDKYIIGAFSKNSYKKTIVFSLDYDEEITINHNELKKGVHWSNYVLGVVHELQSRGFQIPNFNFTFSGNIPGGAGLSSSAALENCVVFGLNHLFNLGLSKEKMIQISMKAEHNFVGVQCGILDQFASMYGKLNNAILLDCNDLSYSYIPIKIKDYEIVLINTNVKHSLANSAYNQRREECNKGVSIIQNNFESVYSLRNVTPEQLEKVKSTMPKSIFNRCKFVLEENLRVQQAKKALLSENWVTFGNLMFSSHNGLKSLYDVSCDELDFLVDSAKNSDKVIGSRMVGGGFGGCTINLIKKGETESFINKIESVYRDLFRKNLSVYKVNISDGTRLI